MGRVLLGRGLDVAPGPVGSPDYDGRRPPQVRVDRARVGDALQDVGTSADRAPAPVPPLPRSAINYIAVGDRLWVPNAAEVSAVCGQAALMVTQLEASRSSSDGAPPALPQRGEAAQVGGPLGHGGGVGAGLGPVPPVSAASAAGLGWGLPAAQVGPVVGGGVGLGFPNPSAAEAQALASQVLELQGALEELKVQRKSEGKELRRRRSKRRSRRRSRSSDSSRSRPSSSGSSDSGQKQPNRKYPQWEGPWKDGGKTLSNTMINRVQGLRVKRRSDLYKFAQDYPGGLGAIFLMQVRQKLLGGAPEKVKDLYRTDPGRWAAAMSGLKEIRDVREVQCLSKIIGELNANKVPVAVDVAAQRIKDILLAKRSGSSWEKASLILLMPPEQASMTAPLPDGALDL